MTDLLARWRERAEELRGMTLEREAGIVDRLADELEGYLRELDDVEVNLRQAAEIGGYNEDYLGQLLRDGKIYNAGKHRSPKIRLKDVPLKPGCGTRSRALTVLSLRRANGLENGSNGGRARAQGGRRPSRRLPSSVSQVGR